MSEAKPTPPTEPTPTTPAAAEPAVAPVVAPVAAPAAQPEPALSRNEGDEPLEDSTLGSQQEIVDILLAVDEDEDNEDVVEETPAAPVEPPPAEPAPTPPPSESPPAAPPEVVPPVVPPAPAEPAPPVSPEPQAVPQPPVAPPATPQPETPTPVAPAAATPPVAPTPEPVPLQSPEQALAAQQQWRTDAEERLSKHFAVPEELLTQLQTEPEVVLPQLQARVFLDAVESAVYAVSSQLPALMAQSQQTVDSNAALEKQFFETWGQLDGKNPDHHATILRLGTVYKTSFPQASAGDFIRDVGAQSMIALRIQPVTAAPTAPAEAVPQPLPHVPVGTGAPGAPGATPASDNPFATLADDAELIEEELDLG